MEKIVGLIGYPLGHSLSPAMHNAAFRQLGLDYEYVPFEVPPEDLREALKGLRALHVAGFNVTIPHKETIVPMLDEVTKLGPLFFPPEPTPFISPSRGYTEPELVRAG